MKKLMVALGAAVVCGAVLADSAVESGTVGYNTIGLEANKWYLVAPQFKDIAAGTETIDLLSNMTLTGLQAVLFTDRANGAQIQIYNAASKSYTIYYYISDSKNGTAWARTKNNVPATMPIDLGEGFWLKVGAIDGTASLSVKGSVKAEAEKAVTVGADGDWQILCNPYPMALTWNNLVTSGLTAVPFADRANGAQIQVFNAAAQAYTIYYYISDSKEGTAWARTKNNVASGTLAEIGQAFWVKAPTTGTLTFKY